MINVVHSEVDHRRLLRIDLTAGRLRRKSRDRLIDGAADWIELSERAGLLNRRNDLLRPRQDERRVRNLRKAKKAQQGRQHGAKHTQQHWAVEEPVAVALHQRLFLAVIEGLGAGMDRKDGILVGARRL